MSIVNDLLRPIFDLVQGPLAGVPSLIGIALWSVPTSVFALLVFKWSSNQRRIAEVKRQIQACLFEIRLFNDDVRAILRAQGEILRHVLRYQLYALKPMVWILPPLLLVMVQLHAFYGYRALRPGDTALLTVNLDSDRRTSGSRPVASLEAPSGLEAETGAVWAPSLGELSWRLRAKSPGSYRVGLLIDGFRVDKEVEVTDRIVRLSPVRPADDDLVGQLEWPSEPPIPATAGISSVTLGYPAATIGLGGWSSQWPYMWMVVFFVLTMVVALALRKPLSVEL